MVEKRWRYLFLAGIMLALMAFTLSGCSGTGDVSGDDTDKDGTTLLDIGVAFPEDDWRSSFLQDFAREVEEKSDGTLKTQIHYIDEYPDMTDTLKEIGKENSQLDIALTADAYMGDMTIPDFYVSGLPYMFEDFDEAWAFAESDVNKKIEDNLPEYNMRVLAHFCGGFRSISAVNPIEQPEDLEGLVVATVKSPILMDMLSVLGANPQASIASEINNALSRGIYTGVEITIPTYWRDKDYQYLPYAAITNHAYTLWSLLINEGTWQGLSADQQKIVKETAEKYAALERTESKKQIEGIIDNLKQAGVTVTYPDPKAFREATEGVRERYSKDYPETYREVVEFLESRRK